MEAADFPAAEEGEASVAPAPLPGSEAQPANPPLAIAPAADDLGSPEAAPMEADGSPGTAELGLPQDPDDLHFWGGPVMGSGEALVPMHADFNGITSAPIVAATALTVQESAEISNAVEYLSRDGKGLKLARQKNAEELNTCRQLSLSTMGKGLHMKQRHAWIRILREIFKMMAVVHSSIREVHGIDLGPPPQWPPGSDYEYPVSPAQVEPLLTILFGRLNASPAVDSSSLSSIPLPT